MTAKIISKYTTPIALAFIIYLTAFSGALFAQIDHFNLYGYAQLDYTAFSNNYQNPGFNQRRLNLIAEFNYFSRLRVIADVEYEGGTDITSGDSTSYGVVKLSRAIIEYSLLPQLKFSAGKMISHFGLYNLIHDASASYYSVDPPLMYSKLSPVPGADPQRLFGKYLIGIALLGNFDLDRTGSGIEYFVGIGNGRGVDPNGDDLNSNMAVNARLIFRPGFIFGFQIGTSYYQDINYYGISGLQNASEASLGFDAQYENSNVQLQAEVMFSTFEIERGKFQNSTIAYAQAAYTFFDVLTPFVNYSIVAYDMNDDENGFTRLNFGLNYSILPNLFLKGEIQFHSTEEDHHGNESFNVYKATIAVAF